MSARLDLTAASRAYLLEPHWNLQALCRVHRVGQTRPVTTIRYLMKNSFEEVSKHPRNIPKLPETDDLAASRRDPETEEVAHESHFWTRWSI
jgi:hypothetical protein